MNIQNLSISVTGGMLMGSGLTVVNSDFTHGLVLVGIGALLQIVVALLQKYGVPVSAAPINQ